MSNYILSEKVKQAIHIAQSIAKENAHNEYSSSHLLKALMHKDIGLFVFIESIDQDGYYIEEWAEVRIESLPKTSRIPENLPGDSSIEAIFYEADNIKLKLGVDEVDEFCVLVSLCTPGVGFTYEQLKTFPLTPQEIIDNISTNNDEDTSRIGVKSTSNKKAKTVAKGTTTLDKYCVDKTFDARNEIIERISGRDAEIKNISEILGRRSKPNVLILGDPGVGKTVLLDGLTYSTIGDNIPEHFKDVRVFELDFIRLVSGAGYKGEVEDRFQKIFEEIKQFNRPILLIDEIKKLTDKNSGNQGLVNILKAEMGKGEIVIIGTATNDAYRKHIEQDEGLSRQFEIVRIEVPTEEETLRMISNSISHYSDHHQLGISENAVSEAIRLAKRYNKERSLPDSAIDLIDRTMSAAKFMKETSLPEISDLEERLKYLKESKLEEFKLVKEQTWLYSQMKDKLSYLLFDELGEDHNFENVTKSKEGFKTLKGILVELKKIASKEKKDVDKNDIASTIASITGIPTGKLQADEKERLLNMEDQLKKRVIGQDHAIKVITEAVLESRSGLSKPGLAIGSFFFSGPTGTGKTELAKALAEFLFQDENSIIRFDMSEFKEEHSAALLYGAPPGYVGYEEGGLLVNKIREKPYAIVLFDEIEKAHPSVFDIFLQILDEGKLHDRLGKEGDFSNAVILFTSNIGS